MRNDLFIYSETSAVQRNNKKISKKKIDFKVTEDEALVIDELVNILDCRYKSNVIRIAILELLNSMKLEGKIIKTLS